MPLMIGVELRHQINTNAVLRKKAIPLVYLTMAANSEMVRMAYNQIVQGFFR